MFSIEQIERALASVDYHADIQWVRHCSARSRLNATYDRNPPAVARLSYLIDCILTSSPEWDARHRAGICKEAAEAAELLARTESDNVNRANTLWMRAALLYELADLPAMSYGTVKNSGLRGALYDLMSGAGMFRYLSTQPDGISVQAKSGSAAANLLGLVDSDVLELARYEHGMNEGAEPVVTVAAAELAKCVSMGITGSDMMGVAAMLRARCARATRCHLEPDLFHALLSLPFPPELFRAQIDAINGGILDPRFNAWGLAAPTGTGKTFLARLLIFDYLKSHIGGAALYVVPSRALVHEVTASLKAFFGDIDVQVTSISAQLVQLSSDEAERLAKHDVLVLTPEKADLLLRLSGAFLSRVKLVVVDEAHHIESGTRGALLEFYLWRLRRIADSSTRIVLLSAVTPNIRELVNWIGSAPAATISTGRSTRMRAGVYRIKKSGNRREGWIDYSDGSSLRLFDGSLPTGKRQLLVQLADRLQVAGPVLIIASGKKECENVADTLIEWKRSQGTLQDLQSNELGSDAIVRLDSRLEREMYADVRMRELLTHRIAYHHAGLPPRVRIAVEDAIRGGYVDFVCATTTLAEGVNFPFSSVIVESLAIRGAPEKGRPARYHPVTPRSFWNIAGRAGRPGVDNEGQAILFEPSLGLDKITYILGAYLDPSINSLEPVRSALGTALAEIKSNADDGKLDLSALRSAVLPPETSRSVQGAINLVRVAIVHSAASGIGASPDELVEGTLAFQQMDSSSRDFAKTLFREQGHVVDDFFAKRGAPNRAMVAELGLSIATLSNLRDYAQGLDDWQIKNMATTVFGGRVNLQSVGYVLGPVCKRMAELEGPELGGLYGDVAAHWISGIPISHIDQKAKFKNWSRLEDLIMVMYSRIQYLLPWGLYAFDELLEEEARSRSIQYDNQVRMISYFSDAGVPSIDALRLTGFDIERVDATRLAKAYEDKGGRSLGVDVVGWLCAEQQSVLEKAVRGFDNRRIDHDFSSALATIRTSSQRTGGV